MEILKIALLILLCIPVLYLAFYLWDKLYLELVRQETITEKEKLHRTAQYAANENVIRNEKSQRKRKLHVVKKK